MSLPPPFSVLTSLIVPVLRVLVNVQTQLSPGPTTTDAGLLTAGCVPFWQLSAWS